MKMNCLSCNKVFEAGHYLHDRCFICRWFPFFFLFSTALALAITMLLIGWGMQ